MSVPTKCSEFYYNGHPKLSYYHTIHAGGKPVNEEYCCPDDFSIGERLKKEADEAKKRAEEDAKAAEEAAVWAAAKEAAEKKAAEREAREAARRAAEEQRKKEKAERVAAEMERQRILAEERAAAEEEEMKAQARAKAEKEEAKRLKDLADAAEAAKKAQEKAEEEERIRRGRSMESKMDANIRRTIRNLKRGCHEAGPPSESFKNALLVQKPEDKHPGCKSQEFADVPVEETGSKRVDEADPKKPETYGGHWCCRTTILESIA